MDTKSLHVFLLHVGGGIDPNEDWLKYSLKLKLT